MNRARISPTFAVAVLALVIACTGTGFAAVTLAKNSVATKHLKKNAVTGPKVKKDTLTGKDINESKLRLPGSTRSIPASTFDSLHSGSTFAYLGSAVHWTGGDDTGLFANLDLPQGAVITDVTVYVLDQNLIQEVSATVRRVDMTTGATFSGTSAFSSGDPASLQALHPAVGSLGPVDNKRFSYALTVRFGIGNAQHSLWGASVSYSAAPAAS